MTQSRRLLRFLSHGTGGALALGLLTAPAATAVTGPQLPVVPIPITAPAGPAPALSPTAQAIADARTKAKATGQPVTVDLLTTATSSTLVNPNGTLTTDDYAAPVRIKQGSSWAPIDATLHANIDGTLSPTAASTGLKFSGGGTGPLATVTTADGQQLSVTAPFALPAPTISGATATYAGVLTPDVDLQVTAQPDGGWRDVIIVKTATAAANPALKTVHFTTAANGLTVASDAAGNITYKDSAGKVRLHAPTPMQWDSTMPPPAAPSSGTVTQARSLFAAPAAPATTSTNTSTPDAPGDSAHVAPITVNATATGIDLTPDQNVLGKGSAPWFIDPSISDDSGTQHWGQVQENHPDTKNYDPQFPLGTGYCGYSAPEDCTGLARYRASFPIGNSPSLSTQPGGAP
ncbi:hypothetical protein C7C46_30340, partial [Streptomyces tateyamensis]